MAEHSTRTTQEILARIEERRPEDLIGFEWPIYVEALPLKAARPFLKEGVKSWRAKGRTRLLADARDYMEFAWEKANNCRGISAGRSIAHYVAWLWLLGDDELWPQIETYEFYGKDQLRRVCEFLELDPDKWDDGIRVNSESELYDD